jgi:hypothetical protein
MALNPDVELFQAAELIVKEQAYMSAFIQFVLQVRLVDRKTDTWMVVRTAGGSALGEVRFYGAWRKYCFFPYPNSLYDPDCLKTIAEFCALQTILQWRQK